MGSALRGSLALAFACVLAACGSTGSPPGHEVTAGDTQNGQSISVHVGDTIRITLSTTFWTIAGSSDASVIQEQGEQVVSPAPRGSCFPGMGCGTTSAVFKAMKAGSATVTATRLSCGEARRCVGAEGNYQLTVVVN